MTKEEVDDQISSTPKEYRLNTALAMASLQNEIEKDPKKIIPIGTDLLKKGKAIAEQNF